MKSAIAPLVVAFMIAAPAVSAADVMYRSVMPDGSVRYGESPERGAKSVKTIPPPPASTGTITVTPQEKEKGRAITVEEGGVTVLPAPPRKPPLSAEPGRLFAPDGLPGRSY